MGMVVTAQSEQETIFVKKSRVTIPTILTIDRDELLFICGSGDAREDIVIGGLYENAKDNQVCGLVEAREFTYFSAVEETHTVDVEGYPLKVGFYQVQTLTQVYALTWPNPIDGHLMEMEYVADRCQPEALVRRGFPITPPPPRPIIEVREVMLAEVGK